VGVAILDIDGTLVDTNYQHALAWYRAFQNCEIVLPVWRVHRHIGMGGDQLVEALTDARTEREHGDDIRAAERAFYMRMIDEVQPLEGARELIEDLRRRRHTVLLASSAHPDEVDRYLDLLKARELADGWTSAADVQRTKPEPDLVEVALERASVRAQDAVMIGDSPWDVQAASRADVPTLAVMTGGFSKEELLSAGAAAVFESVATLCRELDETALR
jgi:HAD superfamily hydrolase (TIGR01509 family)